MKTALRCVDPDTQSYACCSCCCRLIEGPWWGGYLGQQSGDWWLRHIDGAALSAEPLRRRIGYLNTLEDLLKHLGHRMQVGGWVGMQGCRERNGTEEVGGWMDGWNDALFGCRLQGLPGSRNVPPPPPPLCRCTSRSCWR